MIKGIYLVSRIIRDYRFMSNKEHSVMSKQKAFSLKLDAFNYFELLQDELIELGYQVCPSIENNLPITGKDVLPCLNYKLGYHIIKIQIKKIPFIE